MIRKLMHNLALKMLSTGRVSSLLGLRDPSWTQRDYKHLVEEGLEVNAVAWACVMEIATAAAGIPWILRQKPTGKNAVATELADHPLLNLIDRPNPQQGQSAFVEEITAFFIASRNAFILQVGADPDGNSTPVELYPLVPDINQITPIRTTDKTSIVGYKFASEGGRNAKVYTTRQVYHFKGFHPRQEWYGLSPIAIAMRAIDITNESQSWNVSLLQNMAVPPGALQTKEFLPQNQRDVLRSEMEEKLEGVRNARRPALLHGGLEWISFGLTPAEMDWLQGKEDAGLDICRSFNVPPELVGFANAKTYSNYKEARKALYLENVIPWMDRFRDDLNNWLTPMFGDRLELDYNRDAIEALHENKAELRGSLAMANWLSINEKRLADGEDEVDGGDIILIPLSMIPIELSTTEAQAARESYTSGGIPATKKKAHATNGSR